MKSPKDELQEVHDKVMSEIVAAVPQIDDPSVLQCACTEKQVCKICPPSKKVKYLEIQQKRILEKTKMGTPRYVVLAEPTARGQFARREMHLRMKELKRAAEKKLGRRLSYREFREITELKAREIYEAEQKKGLVGKVLEVSTMGQAYPPSSSPPPYHCNDCGTEMEARTKDEICLTLNEPIPTTRWFCPICSLKLAAE